MLLQGGCVFVIKLISLVLLWGLCGLGSPAGKAWEMFCLALAIKPTAIS